MDWQMKQYLDLLKKVLDEGAEREDRTGVGTISIFGPQMRFNLSEGFPLLTTKKLHVRSIIHELLWFLSGSTNIGYLRENGVTIWDEWADKNGELGPVYGTQWRHWKGADGKEHDQIAELIEALKSNPYSRRHIVSSWNVGDLNKMALPPCHAVWQCYVSQGKLSLMLYQRSADLFLGVPFNIASYALLTHMLAQTCGYEPGEFVWTGGDVHLYRSHVSQAREQLGRVSRPLPQLVIRNPRPDIFSYRFDDFVIHGYNPHPHIAAEVAV